MTEIFALGAIAATAFAMAMVGSWLGIRFKQLRCRPEGGSDPAPSFSPERYEAMGRLLDPGEFEFVRSRRCKGAKLAARWYASRRRIFRFYLRDIARDFEQLHAAARAAVADSPEEYSALVGVLMRQQVTFWRAMAAVEFRLTMHAWGLGKVDAGRLIAAIESMRLEIEAFRPASLSA